MENRRAVYIKNVSTEVLGWQALFESFTSLNISLMAHGRNFDLDTLTHAQVVSAWEQNVESALGKKKIPAYSVNAEGVGYCTGGDNIGFVARNNRKGHTAVYIPNNSVNKKINKQELLDAGWRVEELSIRVITKNQLKQRLDAKHASFVFARTLATPHYLKGTSLYYRGKEHLSVQLLRKQANLNITERDDSDRRVATVGSYTYFDHSIKRYRVVYFV